MWPWQTPPRALSPFHCTEDYLSLLTLINIIGLQQEDLMNSGSKALGKDLGFQHRMMMLVLQHFNYNSSISVSQNLAILMTEYGDSTKYF